MCADSAEVRGIKSLMLDFFSIFFRITCSLEHYFALFIQKIFAFYSFSLLFFFCIQIFILFNTIVLQNCRKVTLSMSVTICADATNSVQTEYYRTEYESNWKSLKQRKRSLFFWLTWIFLKACRIDFYGVIYRDGR